MKRLLLIALIVLTGCYSPYDAAARLLSKPIQCVPYAREVSGIQLFGNAHTWWDQAASSKNPYTRGSAPKPGSVLVLSKTQRLRYGHVAVVKKIVNDREIEVAHSNWGWNSTTRRKVYEAMRVRDVSPMNDWSQLRFWSPDERSYGAVYPAKGFVYKQG